MRNAGSLHFYTLFCIKPTIQELLIKTPAKILTYKTKIDASDKSLKLQLLSYIIHPLKKVKKKTNSIFLFNCKKKKKKIIPGPLPNP